jgi:hypothetical protein
MIKYLNIILFAAMVTVNYLANALPINNRTTGELSDMYPNLFVPAGLTFSIWGAIYLLLLGYCIIQFRQSDQAAVPAIGTLFALTCVLNAGWILAWHYTKVPLSVIIMAGLLVSLILINLNISNLNLGFIKAAFGIYLGWICIATIANIAAMLVDTGWNGLGISEEIWTIIMIAAGTVIVSLSITGMKNPFIGLSVVWAFAGIVIKRQDDYRSIVVAALAGIVIVGVITALGFFRRTTF